MGAAVAVAAVFGAVSSGLAVTTAVAEDGAVTVDVSPSCENGGAIMLAIHNDTPTDQVVSFVLDEGNDGEWNYRDHVPVEAESEVDYPILLGENGVYRVIVTTEDGGVIADEVVELDCPPGERYYVTSYDGTVWRVTGEGFQRLTYAEWAAAGFPTPAPAPTDYVRYAWSSSISAVTFFGENRERWVWDHLSPDEWARAGFPSPRVAGWIEGSTYYQWSTSDQIFVQDVGGVRHALTFEEWRQSGYEPFERRAGQGFSKLTWDNTIGFFTNTAAGQGSPIDYNRWSSEGFPQPSSAARFPGDQLWRNYGSPDIWYAGPTVYRRINGAEWAAMGNPAPEVRGAPAPGAGGNPAPAPGGGGTPPRPTQDKDCGDYRSQSEAQADFNRYFPAYGDIFRLDGDNDGTACESYDY